MPIIVYSKAQHFRGGRHCIDFDGDTEAMISNTTVTGSLGFGNAWTNLIWINPDDLNPGGDWQGVPLNIGTSNSMIEIIVLELAENSFVDISLFDNVGTVQKRFRFNNVDWTVGVWVQLLVTWDGTDPRLWLNAVEETSILKITDNALTMEDADRAVYIAQRDTGSAHFDGKIQVWASWSVVLDQSNITAIYNNGDGIDLNANSGNYNQSTNNQSWHEIGNNAGAIGEDRGNGGINLDLTDEAIDITAVNDRVPVV